jgi:hypothetical protein
MASPSVGFGIMGTAYLMKYCTAGYHKYCALERGTGNGTTTWYGDAGLPPLVSSGLRGWTMG